jgi:ZIP family zinc transporter
MSSILILLAIASAVMTFLGGLFSLRFRDQAHLITSFSAGVVIGLAFFDLLPESIGLLGEANIQLATIFIALGFTIYLVLDRLFHNVKEHSKHDHAHEEHIEHGHRGTLRATSLVTHSFLDGLAIGFAFQVSTSLGFLVAVAVLAHDFSDGINTITAIVKDGGKRTSALKWLLLDALAPMLGIFATLFFTISENILGLILALFCGFFFYIGASDLIPESYHNHPTKLTTLMTILGMLFIFIAIAIVG